MIRVAARGRLVPFLAAVLAAVLCSAPLPAAAEGPIGPIAFSGAVARGEAFQRALPGGLAFQLRPTRSGWRIWIGDPKHPTRDYAAIVTPPFHGPSPLYIQGWHFRNADNSGPNEPGPKNLNVPQRRRAFFFVTRETDYRTAEAALGVALWPADRDHAEVRAAREAFQRIDKAEGILDVKRLDLGNLVVGDRAWIERMGFAVEILAPGE